MSAQDAFLKPGRNCWCVTQAKRFAVILDADRYFEVVAEAIESATHSVMIVGWDLHGDARLRHGGDGRPETLAEILAEAARRRPELEIRLLVWDFIFFYALERELFPALRHGWIDHPSIDFRFASDHPIGGSHHQKVVVIDDAIGFAGGIDLTVARWDRTGHDATMDERRLPNGAAYGPFHDVQVAVDGEAARRLGALARERWRDATGETLSPPPAVPSRWPAALEAQVDDVRVGIARTAPAHEGRPARREIQALHLDMIARARRLIYTENQYLTSSCVRDALAARLREEDGPEVVIVTPQRQVGRLEVKTLGQLRKRWLGELSQHDHHDRLRVLYPLAAGDPDLAVNVHAKVMVIDDDVLRVGSANFTNRSMGLDTECDVVLAADGDPRVAQAIARVRDELVAHHLGVEPEEVSAALAEASLVEVLDAACKENPRIALLELPQPSEEPLIADDVIDPFEPMDCALACSVLPPSLQREGRRRLPRVLLLVVVLLGLAAAWAWTPLRAWVAPDRLADLASGLEGSLWGPLVFVFVMAVASMAMVPITAIIVAGALLFGPLTGAICGLSVSLLSASGGYAAGRRLLHKQLRALDGKRLHQLSRALAKRGILAVLAVRVVPVAPFTVVNFVAGSSHVRFRDFILGTILGMAPGIIGLTVAADRVAAAVRSPTATTLVVAVAIVIVVAGALFFMRRWLKRVASSSELAALGEEDQPISGPSSSSRSRCAQTGK